MFDNIIAKAEELLNRFGEGIVEILRGEKDIAMYSRDLSRILCFQFITQVVELGYIVNAFSNAWNFIFPFCIA